MTPRAADASLTPARLFVAPNRTHRHICVHPIHPDERRPGGTRRSRGGGRGCSLSPPACSPARSLVVKVVSLSCGMRAHRTLRTGVSSSMGGWGCSSLHARAVAVYVAAARESSSRRGMPTTTTTRLIAFFISIFNRRGRQLTLSLFHAAMLFPFFF